MSAPVRVEKLVRAYGKQVDYCQTLHVGDNLNDATQLFGKPEEKHPELLNGKPVFRVSFPPVVGPYRSLWVDGADKVLELECFDGTHLKDPSALPLFNAVNYRN